MSNRRPAKQYGSVKKRGRYVPEWAKAKCNKPPTPIYGYTVDAGKQVWVRPLNSGGRWKQHQTKVKIFCHGFHWRNERFYGFAQGDWEVKVRVGDFVTVLGKQERA
jgi:hypothetical protein